VRLFVVCVFVCLQFACLFVCLSENPSNSAQNPSTIYQQSITNAIWGGLGVVWRKIGPKSIPNQSTIDKNAICGVPVFFSFLMHFGNILLPLGTHLGSLCLAFGTVVGSILVALGTILAQVWSLLVPKARHNEPKWVPRGSKMLPKCIRKEKKTGTPQIAFLSIVD
jgi:hypothetical protein